MNTAPGRPASGRGQRRIMLGTYVLSAATWTLLQPGLRFVPRSIEGFTTAYERVTCYSARPLRQRLPTRSKDG